VNPDARRGAVSFTALQLGQGALGAPHPQAWDRPMALGGGFRRPSRCLRIGGISLDCQITTATLIFVWKAAPKIAAVSASMTVQSVGRIPRLVAESLRFAQLTIEVGFRVRDD
jgi:hypothetical protein